MAKRKSGWKVRLRRWTLRAALAVVLAVAAWFAGCVVTLVALRWVDPPTTAVHAQRRVESWFRDAPYAKRNRFVSLERIDDALEWAVVAAEDTRFYEHAGVDWEALGDALDEAGRRGRLRGASTLTQQLVKNLFLTTRRSWVRKAAEIPLAYAADAVLPKRRILELYLNVVEWGDGVYGAEAAARHHYGVSAEHLGRERASRLAACLPDPRRRRPERMDRYSAIIRARMGALGH